MSTVINSGAFLDLFDTLGWETSKNDLLVAALGAGLPAGVIYKYLAALAAAPAGLDDAAIQGVTAQQGAAITAFLKARGLVGV